MNDLTGHGRADGMCIVDTRTNDVIVTYTPTAPAADRFTPFVLDPAPLPMDAGRWRRSAARRVTSTATAGWTCWSTYWGRTPVLFLAKAGATTVSQAAYQPAGAVAAAVASDGKYHGPQWNTNAVDVGDFDGDGHPDIIIGNYFPDSGVLDPHGQNNVQMTNSLSSANNGGGAHVLRWTRRPPATEPVGELRRGRGRDARSTTPPAGRWRSPAPT